MSDDLLYSKCQRVIHDLLGKYAWKLLKEEEWVGRLYARALAEQVQTVAQLEKLAVNIYALELFDACGSTGERCERGFREISKFLFRLASGLYGDLDAEAHEIIVQDALARIYVGLGKCKSPGAFLLFCQLRLQHAVDAYRREQKRWNKQDPLPDDEDEDTKTKKELIQPANLPEVSLQDCVELRKQELRRFQELFQRFPKAQRQLLAVYYVYYMKLDREAVVDKLATTTKNLDVLLSRGRVKLGTDEEFVSLLRTIAANCKDFDFDVPLLIDG